MKLSRLSQAKITNNIQSIKVDSTGGIGDAGGGNQLRGQNSSRRHMDSTNSSGNKPHKSKRIELTLNKKLKRNPICLVGNPDKRKANLQDNDRLMSYLRNFIKSNKLKGSTNQERNKEEMVEKLKDFLVYLEK